MNDVAYIDEKLTRTYTCTLERENESAGSGCGGDLSLLKSVRFLCKEPAPTYARPTRIGKNQEKTSMKTETEREKMK